MGSEEKTLILMIDDSEDDFVLIRDMLDEAVPGKYEMSWASSFSRGLKMAEESIYAVAFLDYRLGDGDGLKFLMEARAKGLKTPMVFLTGKGNYWVGVEAIRRGVSDFLVKGEVTPALLERAILHAIERNRMLMALTASEEKFRAVFEDSGTSIAITDTEGLISDTNPCFQDMFGARADALHGQPLASLVYPGDTHPLSCAFDKLRNGAGSCTSLENRYVGNGGKTIWGKTLLSSIAGEDGSVHKVVALISDITREKLAEERIAEVARFPEQNPFPVLRIGADGVITYANKSSAPVLKKWGVSVGGKAPADMMASCASALASNLLSEIEVDCGDVVFSIALSPVPEIGYVNVYGREITEWKKATSKLQLAAKVYESAMDGILVTDADGVIISVNPAFSNITGYTAVEAVGKKPSILKSGRHEAEFYREMWAQLRNV
ncbi:MAG: PAS domain S-box protein, partial [Nitrospinae bacterium]|nr:PAS domain S-box protein [Nitrospinota bacterium]